MTAVVDTFDRADGGIGAAYSQTHTSEVTIVSNAAEGVALQETGVLRTQEVYGGDQRSAITIEAPQAGEYFTASVRGAGTGATLRQYRASIGATNGDYYLSRVTGGSGTDIAIGDRDSPVNGDVIECRAVGSTISLYYNGAFVTSVDDSTYTDGDPGFELFGAARVAQAEFEDLSTGAAGSLVDSTRLKALVHGGLVK